MGKPVSHYQLVMPIGVLLVENYYYNDRCDVMFIDWQEIESVGKTARGKDKKVYLDHLPKGGKCIPKNKINWKESKGMSFYTLYDEKEYEIIIEDYLCSTGYLILNVKNNHKCDFKIHSSNVPSAKFNTLINNVFGNPNIKNRDLIIKTIGEDKAKTLLPTSNKKIEVCCPTCPSKQSIWIRDLTKKEFRCMSCSDGFSYPEKLTKNILDKLGISYTTQYKFLNSNHRYDFYLCDYNVIIETHGSQHYEEKGRKGARTLKEEQENDRYKRELAIANGIKTDNYHEVDCRISTLDYCRKGLVEVLSKYIEVDLTEEEWKELDIRSQASNFIKVIEEFNSGVTQTSLIAKKYSLDMTTVQKYLNKGTKMGLCNYKGKEVQKKLVSIPIVATHVDTGKVIEFDSFAQAHTMFGFKYEGIKKCIEGKINSYKNYKWSLKTV